MIILVMNYIQSIADIYIKISITTFKSASIFFLITSIILEFIDNCTFFTLRITNYSTNLNTNYETERQDILNLKYIIILCKYSFYLQSKYLECLPHSRTLLCPHWSHSE